MGFFVRLLVEWCVCLVLAFNEVVVHVAGDAIGLGSFSVC